MWRFRSKPAADLTNPVCVCRSVARRTGPLRLRSRDRAFAGEVGWQRPFDTARLATVSGGTATRDDRSSLSSGEALIRAADNAMYLAKEKRQRRSDAPFRRLILPEGFLIPSVLGQQAWGQTSVAAPGTSLTGAERRGEQLPPASKNRPFLQEERAMCPGQHASGNVARVESLLPEQPGCVVCALPRAANHLDRLVSWQLVQPGP